MAADDRRTVSGQVDIKADSGARVALDLARQIANLEGKSDSKDREYWLRLFYQCNMALQGNNTTIEHVLRAGPKAGQ
jgi:hypothetical protein